MLKALNTAVESAISAAPSVFFIDEIDSFHSRDRETGSRNGYIIGVVNGLLTQIDRLSATPGVILIAATNNVERVDSAVIRPGRFDRHIHVGRPDRSGILSMLEGLLSGLKVDPVGIDRLCDQLLGASGAEIAAMVRDARTRARAERSPLSFGHLLAAADAIQPPRRSLASSGGSACMKPDTCWPAIFWDFPLPHMSALPEFADLSPVHTPHANSREPSAI